MTKLELEDTPVQEIEEVRKFLVVVDDSDEMFQALRYAAWRVKKTDGVLLLLYVHGSPELHHWLGVGEIMQDERNEEAEARLAEVALRAKKITGVNPETVVREGDSSEAILDLLKEDKHIRVIVLGANSKGDNPGPIISSFFGRNAVRANIPITIIPGDLSDDEIDRFS